MRYHLLMLIAAIVCFAVYALIGMDVLVWTHAGAWLGGGLFLWAGSQLPVGP